MALTLDLRVRSGIPTVQVTVKLGTTYDAVRYL